MPQRFTWSMFHFNFCWPNFKSPKWVDQKLCIYLCQPCIPHFMKQCIWETSIRSIALVNSKFVELGSNPSFKSQACQVFPKLENVASGKYEQKVLKLTPRPLQLWWEWVTEAWATSYWKKQKWDRVSLRKDKRDWDRENYLDEKRMQSNVTRFGNFLVFGQLFKAFGNN